MLIPPSVALLLPSNLLHFDVESEIFTHLIYPMADRLPVLKRLLCMLAVSVAAVMAAYVKRPTDVELVLWQLTQWNCECAKSFVTALDS